MKICLTKVSDEKHKLEITRDDGSTDSVELESKTFITHDFLHYAIEGAAGLKHSFWGQLAAGKTFAQMNPDNRRDEMLPSDLSSEDAVTEAVVGPLSGAIVHDVDPEFIISGIQNIFSAQGRPVPSWLIPQFIYEVKENMRRLLGEWRSVSYGSCMELEF